MSLQFFTISAVDILKANLIKAGPVLLAMNPFKGAKVRGNELVAGCGKKPEFLLTYGKLIDIHFKPTGKVFGAKIQTCKFHLEFKMHFNCAYQTLPAMLWTVLLEKMRVIQLAIGERSFHVFYQLCYGALSSLKGCIMLIDVSIHDEKQ
ncbi:hypothetical protein Scep_009503 [Stephania cephalantha]|uniref:Myosin motor domain-containing protein n=1 Tax=Stephania cephalantha TaxID=152367 RepID=A0AAP0PD82_9MAGN